MTQIWYLLYQVMFWTNFCGFVDNIWIQLFSILWFCEFFFFQGVVTSASSLILEFVQQFPDDYKGCVNLAINRLSKVIKFCSKFYSKTKHLDEGEINKFISYNLFLAHK